MNDHAPDLDELAHALAAGPKLNVGEQHLAVALYRVLAERRPVSVATLAERSGLEESAVGERLAAWAAVFRDEHGDVIAFWGLALPEMSHRYVTGGRKLHTWCAWDTLFITPILGRVAEVASSCPVTGRPVVLTVGPESVRRADPAEAVVSFLSPQQPWGDDVLTFCHYVLMFASGEAGARWVDDHPGTFLVSLDDAFELGRRVNALRFGPALATPGAAA
jgi:alkylmercury lyase